MAETPRERAIARIGLGNVARLEEGGLVVTDQNTAAMGNLAQRRTRELAEMRARAEAVVRAAAMPGNRNGLAALIQAIEALRDALTTTTTEGGER